MIASVKGHVDVCRLLLDRGASIYAVDIDGASSLYIASKFGHVDVCRLLLDHGADASVKTLSGETALSIAVKKGNKSVVRLLKEMVHTAESRLLQEKDQDDVASHQAEQVYEPSIHPKESQVEEDENDYDGCDSTMGSIDQITTGFQGCYDS